MPNKKSIPRRTFLSQTSAITALGCCGLKTHAEIAGQTAIQAEDFQPLVGSNFRVSNEKQNIVAKLIEVHELKDAKRPSHLPRKNSFTLAFRPQKSEKVQDGNYVFSHPELGKAKLFLSPFGGAGLFQVCFN